jgi:multidrug resistance efflux pump
MLELLLCSSVTILPDFLYRRYVQGKRIGQEINLFSVWYELRWGITLCLILTVSLITAVFYFHPSTTSAIAFFRTVPVITEKIGRVDEVYVSVSQSVKKGDPLFRLDDSEERAAAETTRRRIAEIDASILVARTELATADARISEAESALTQAEQELARNEELMARNASTVAQREIDRLVNLVDGRRGGLEAAVSAKRTLETQLDEQFPAERASAEAALAEAEVQLGKTIVRAGVDGRVEQFALRAGDIVNPVLRPAGILVPTEAGRISLQAGFGQIEAQVLKVGMTAEAACIAKPWTIVPMVVTDIQGSIATGQIRPTDQLVDPTQVTRPGAVLAYLEPMFPGGLSDLPPGASCIVNAYTSNHERLADPDLGTMAWLGLHVVDAIGLVHALILRLQAIVMPVQILVLGGH